jgi:hypothetical protein
MAAGRPSRSVSISATSHIAVMCRWWPRTAFGSLRAAWTARIGGELPGVPSARMIPTIVSAREPNMTGVKCVRSAPSSGNVSATTSASAVQPM